MNQIRKDQGKYFGPTKNQKEQKVVVKSRHSGLELFASNNQIISHQIMWMEEKSPFFPLLWKSHPRKAAGGGWDLGIWGLCEEQRGHREGGMSKGDTGKEG